MSLTFSCESTSCLPDIARKIFWEFPDVKIFIFKGEMGSGKTTLIKALCSYLEVEDITSSPTFSIINEYKTPKSGNIYHMDFYRIDNIQEAANTGFEEYIFSGSFCFIEWPEIIQTFLPAHYVSIEITINQNNQGRVLKLDFFSQE